MLALKEKVSLRMSARDGVTGRLEVSARSMVSGRVILKVNAGVMVSGRIFVRVSTRVWLTEDVSVRVSTMFRVTERNSVRVSTRVRALTIVSMRMGIGLGLKERSVWGEYKSYGYRKGQCEGEY